MSTGGVGAATVVASGEVAPPIVAGRQNTSFDGPGVLVARVGLSGQPAVGAVPSSFT